MEKTIIAFKDFEYIIAMESFFKKEHESGSQNYLIPTDHLIWFRKTFFQKLETVAATSALIACPATGINC